MVFGRKNKNQPVEEQGSEVPTAEMGLSASPAPESHLGMSSPQQVSDELSAPLLVGEVPKAPVVYLTNQTEETFENQMRIDETQYGEHHMTTVDGNRCCLCACTCVSKNIMITDQRVVYTTGHYFTRHYRREETKNLTRSIYAAGSAHAWLWIVCSVGFFISGFFIVLLGATYDGSEDNDNSDSSGSGSNGECTGSTIVCLQKQMSESSAGPALLVAGAFCLAVTLFKAWCCRDYTAYLYFARSMNSSTYDEPMVMTTKKGQLLPLMEAGLRIPQLKVPLLPMNHYGIEEGVEFNKPFPQETVLFSTSRIKITQERLIMTDQSLFLPRCCAPCRAVCVYIDRIADVTRVESGSVPLFKRARFVGVVLVVVAILLFIVASQAVLIIFGVIFLIVGLIFIFWRRFLMSVYNKHLDDPIQLKFGRAKHGRIEAAIRHYSVLARQRDLAPPVNPAPLAIAPAFMPVSLLTDPIPAEPTLANPIPEDAPNLTALSL